MNIFPNDHLLEKKDLNRIVTLHLLHSIKLAGAHQFETE